MEALLGPCVAIVLAPLAGALLAGLGGPLAGRRVAHSAAIAGVGTAFVLSCWVWWQLMAAKSAGAPYVLDTTLYTWIESGALRLGIGFLIDELSATMMVVVTFVSLMVHVYTIGYMRDDGGYTRFFSYIALFTFAMLMLVMANNFLQLFFGWEGVGLVSYLLIGFWFDRESAIQANLKAFLVNRVGDLALVLGIAAVFVTFGTLDYAPVFAAAPDVAAGSFAIWPGQNWPVLTVIAVLLFIGAMAKSAQAPLHVWLPDSMEGPTPISALIHAATMVTAGIFLVARTSPIFELSEAALSMVLVVGAITAFFMGLLGLVQTDIKRVVAYSTLSQLGYMTTALGASAYGAAMFHLTTHAFFKALLFLAAGSVIIALHHEQDMRRMGGLARRMPVTYVTALVGTLALVGFPGFSGFFSKDALIEAVHAAAIPGAGLAYAAVLGGVFVTALYSFRLLFMVFHGKSRMDHHTAEHVHESPWVVTGPLIALAIPSVLAGAALLMPMVFGDYFGSAITVLPAHDALSEIGAHVHGPLAFLAHGALGPATWLMLAGAVTAWALYLRWPGIPGRLQRAFAPLHRLLDRKYYADDFNAVVFAGGVRVLGRILWRGGDMALIDGLAINGTARGIGRLAVSLRTLQSGYLYHYAFAMITGLAVLLAYVWFAR